MIDVLGNWGQQSTEAIMIVSTDVVDHAVDRLFPPPIDFDPVQWAEDHGLFLWSKQKEFLHSVVDHRYTAVRACHDVGKSFGVAVLLVAWADTYGHDSFCIFTAPTYPQVNAIVGREVRDLLRKLDLPHLELLESNELKYKGHLRGYGRKPADHNPAGFSGIHAKYPLVIIDEGGGVPKNIFTGAETVATNQFARIITIGNPDNPVSHFHEIMRPRIDRETGQERPSQWNVIKIDAFSSPNFTDEKVPSWLRPLLIDPEWVEGRKEEWGEDSPLYVSKILAEFPTSSEHAVFSFELILKCFQETDKDASPRVLCLDVASSGKDESIAYAIRADGDVTHEFSYRVNDLMDLADEAFDWWKMNKQSKIVVDANGLGEGVYSRLKQRGARVVPFYGQMSPRDTKQFVNARAEAAFCTRNALKNDDIRLPLGDAILAGELPTIQWEYGVRNKFKLMSKEDMAKMGLASPNRADALTMGVWVLRLGRIASKNTGFASKGLVTAQQSYAT